MAYWLGSTPNKRLHRLIQPNNSGRRKLLTSSLFLDLAINETKDPKASGAYLARARQEGLHAGSSGSLLDQVELLSDLHEAEPDTLLNALLVKPSGSCT